MSIEEFARAERMGIRLGYLGLAPFLLGAFTALLVEDLHQVALRAFLLYSIVILSFMGGVHWGLGLVLGTRQSTRLLIAVMPALIGWSTLLVLPVHLALAILGGAYIAQWFVDRPILAELPIPPWYLEMRPRLAYTVAGCHLFMLFRLLG